MSITHTYSSFTPIQTEASEYLDLGQVIPRRMPPDTEGTHFNCGPRIESECYGRQLIGVKVHNEEELLLLLLKSRDSGSDRY